MFKHRLYNLQENTSEMFVIDYIKWLNRGLYCRLFLCPRPGQASLAEAACHARI